MTQETPPQTPSAQIIEPAAGSDEPATSSERDPRRAALAAWLALTAPGLLLTRALVLLAVIVLPWLAPATFSVAPAVRAVAGALLLMHVGCTVLVMRFPGQWPPALAWLAGLSIDALFAGVLLGSDPRWHGPAGALAIVVLGTVFAAGGWRALLFSTVPVAVGAAVGMATNVAALIQLSSGLSLASLRALTTQLSVEITYAGTSAVDAPASLAAGTLAFCLIALAIGLGVSLARVRRARDVVAVQVLAAARLVM